MPVADRAVHDAHARDRAAVLVVVRVEDQRAQRRVRIARRRRHALRRSPRAARRCRCPSFALTSRMSSGSAPIRSCTSCFRRSGSAPGRSILLRTGMISSPASSARNRFDSVCAWMPCDASTTRIAPSHAASERETSYVKSTWPGVSMRLSSYVLPSCARVVHPHGVELDRDAALALEVERVEHLLLHLALLERARGLDQPVGQRGLAVIDVRDDAEVADVVELQCRLEFGKWLWQRNIAVIAATHGPEKRKRPRDVLAAASCQLKTVLGISLPLGVRRAGLSSFRTWLRLRWPVGGCARRTR